MNSEHELAMSGLAHGEKPGKKPKKEVHAIHARKAAKGYVMEHHHTHPEHHPMEEHTAPNKEAMMAHMEEHMPESGGEAAADPNEAEEQAVGME